MLQITSRRNINGSRVLNYSTARRPAPNTGFEKNYPKRSASCASELDAGTMDRNTSKNSPGISQRHWKPVSSALSRWKPALGFRRQWQPEIEHGLRRVVRDR